MKCQSCKKKIPGGTYCPFCGAQQPVFRQRKTIIAVAVVSLAALLLIAGVLAMTVFSAPRRFDRELKRCLETRDWDAMQQLAAENPDRENADFYATYAGAQKSLKKKNYRTALVSFDRMRPLAQGKQECGVMEEFEELLFPEAYEQGCALLRTGHFETSEDIFELMGEYEFAADLCLYAQIMQAEQYSEGGLLHKFNEIFAKYDRLSAEFLSSDLEFAKSVSKLKSDLQQMQQGNIAYYKKIEEYFDTVADFRWIFEEDCRGGWYFDAEQVLLGYCKGLKEANEFVQNDSGFGQYIESYRFDRIESLAESMPENFHKMLHSKGYQAWTQGGDPYEDDVFYRNWVIFWQDYEEQIVYAVDKLLMDCENVLVRGIYNVENGVTGNANEL
ncbi:hypothetical protein [Feifania hominis]|uniref:Uncharacterized protein n=1 Tax=Feifania hominis TaxID=2763660 RepID=A0A926DFW4_9FIRM|nr:hypothetical protein [Feifania hominis]MBC8536280.1 hypothetical protein [Feifania hominis]